MMHDVLVMGAGKIGRAITEMLSESGDYIVTVADKSDAHLEQHIKKHENVKTLALDVYNKQSLLDAMQNKFAVLSACPFDITRFIAEAAAEANIHYLDLTEDVECTRLVKELAKNANCAFIPQSGLAPGFITIATNALTEKFEELRNVHMRVGALPRYPSNTLKYNLTWSTEGLINEYCNPCEAIVEGKLIQVPPLEEVETFSLDGVTYEAFNTSGGLGTLCETLEGKVENLNYRTVRYPGHRDLMKTLLHDLRLRNRQELLKEIFETSLPITYQDVVLVFISVSGLQNGELVQETYTNKIYSREINGHMWSGIQITTSAGICGVLDLLAQKKLPQKGLIKQEEINFEDFINNRFGRYYAMSSNDNSNHSSAAN